MASKAEIEATLRLVSKAWGRQKGYAFFPWIDRDEQVRSGKRQAGFHEGPSFQWPLERREIVDHMLNHTQHDLYWCPSLFEYPRRSENFAMDEHSLWADLDAVDPRTISDFQPTIAWETSPGRYQALWLAAGGDFQGASWPGNENQRLTYYLEADRGGWDTVQLLRFPGWENHKPHYKRPDGTYPKGKLLWKDGRRWFADELNDLPPLSNEAVAGSGLTDALEAEIDNVDRHKVLARVRLRLTKYTRDQLAATEATGDRSDEAWQIERSLADAGCTIAEIVAIVRQTVWNKYTDRADELRRLILEASKAVSQVPEAKKAKTQEDGLEELDDELERGEPTRFGDLLRNVKKPKFLIRDLLTEGACGFIAGEPKAFKSWTGLDLALSVSTGADFLGHFQVEQPGPVLYVQEEDPLPTLKQRTGKIWKGKASDKLVLVPSDTIPTVEWLPPAEDEKFDPDVNAYVQHGVVISDEAWQLWFDDMLAKGMDGVPYRLMILDTLMMMAGEVEENKSQEMTTKIFKPLKVLCRKHNVSVVVIHHMGKSEKARPGQRMLGSVANHAWAEDSLYLSEASNGDVRMDLESKSIPGTAYRISNLRNREWNPQVAPWRTSDDDKAIARVNAEERAGRAPSQGGKRSPTRGVPALLAILRDKGPMNTTKLAAAAGLSRGQVWKNLRRALEQGLVIETKGEGDQRMQQPSVWSVPE